VCLGYVAVALFQDPASAQFPDIPQGLLLLTGISAVTYAGAKLVRDPGPGAKGAARATKSNNDINFTVNGANLSNKAKFSIDGAQINADPAATTCIPQDASTELCTSLTFTIKNVQAYQTGDHVLSVINPDGRTADFSFTLSPPSITSVTPTPLPKGNKQAALTIVGSDLRDKSRLEWLAPLASEPTTPTITSQSAIQIVATLDAGANTGTGTLTVISPNGAKVATPVSVS
jgi:hypothetical protein